MDRRSFFALAPAFPAGVSAALVVKKDDQEDFTVLDISVLKTQPGDVVVFSAPGEISPDTADRLMKHFERHFPTLKAMVLGDAMKIQSVLRP